LKNKRVDSGVHCSQARLEFDTPSADGWDVAFALEWCVAVGTTVTVLAFIILLMPFWLLEKLLPALIGGCGRDEPSPFGLLLGLGLNDPWV
jgi:hypothetical protein